MKGLRVITLALLISAPIVRSEDSVTDLQERLRQGSETLEFEPAHGYLVSLLKTLHVPVSSQTLVFSQTSLQSNISPQSPRALYFNDDVYVGWVPGARTIEIMGVDPQRGPVFYELAQEDDGKPTFEPVGGHVCSVCHYDSSQTKFVPRLVFSSVIPNEKGSVEGTIPLPADDQTPMEQRWGGWYVTGTHGSQRHLGNVVLPAPVSPFSSLPSIDYSRSLNVTELRGRFDTTRYLSPHSDIVALMVLAHQVEVQNRITLATARPDTDARETGEPLVKAMLFSGAAALKEPVKGTSSFEVEFSSRGPKDSRGQSLRDFDLKTRLFRYPLSYMIYSRGFDQMPDSVKSYVYRRLNDVLTGRDRSPDFGHLSSADRAAILEILLETKADFPR